MTTKLKSPIEQEGRRKVGKLLKALRDAEGLTQKNVADATGMEYYTFVSQLESGYGRVPSEMYERYAKVLKVDVKRFTQAMLFYYDKATYKALFGALSPEVGTADWVRGSRK